MMNKGGDATGALHSSLIVLPSSFPKVCLQRLNTPIALLQRLDCAGGGAGAGESGDDGDLVGDGEGADLAFIGLGAFARGGVDQELDLAVLDEVLDVGPALGELADAGGSDACPG